MDAGGAGVGRRLLTSALVLCLLAGPASLMAQPAYHVAVSPEYLPIELWQRFNPLILYLEAAIRARFELLVPRSVEELIDLVKKREVAFSYQNPYVLVLTWEASVPLALTVGAHGATESRSVIIVRKNSGIIRLNQLKGGRVSVGSLYSAGGFIEPRILMSGQGVDVERDMTVVVAKGNKQETVLHDVLDGQAEAGFVDEEVLNRVESKGVLSPGQLQELTILAHTPSYPNWIFSAVNTVPDNMKKRMTEALLKVSHHKAVVDAARIQGFVPVPDTYLENYRKRMAGR